MADSLWTVRYRNVSTNRVSEVKIEAPGESSAMLSVRGQFMAQGVKVEIISAIKE